MPAVRSPDSSWAQLGTFCSFSYYCQGQIHPDIRRWDTPWARSVLQQQRAPGRALQGGGTAPVWSCSSPTGCLWEQVLPVGLAVLQRSNLAQDSPASRPGGQLKEPTGMQHLVPGQVAGAMGIKRALAPWEDSGYSFPPVPMS